MKEDRYTEALNTAKMWYENTETSPYIKGVLKGIFPELAESEDERIRKELIDAVQSLWDNDALPMPLTTIKRDEWLAWLEKQDEKVNIIENFDTEFEKQVSHLLASVLRKDYEYTEGFVKWVSSNLLGYAKYELEKQGEDKPALEAVNESANNANKVEPRFHKGEWITNGYLCCQISDILDDRYIVNTKFEKRSAIPFKPENDWHLWTIRDAKDGDVLAEDSCIFIIQKLGDNGTAAKTYCTLYDDGDFNDGSILYFDIDSTKPATKEQRDLLEKAMADAGYTFDFEKKELKEIEADDDEEDDKEADDKAENWKLTLARQRLGNEACIWKTPKVRKYE